MGESEAEAVRVARSKLDTIEFISQRGALVSRVAQFEGKRVLVMAESPAGRKVVIAVYIDLSSRLNDVVKHPLGIRLLVPLQSRYEVFGDVREKLVSKYPRWSAELLQMARGDTQNERSKPQYVFVGRSNAE